MTTRPANTALIVDLELAKRLERTEGIANARFVEARKNTTPDCRARWIEVAGTLAMFDGIDSPCTQTFGLGINGQPTESELDHLESFFQACGASVHHEVAPLISAELLATLNRRNYHPIEFTNVLCRRIGPDTDMPVSRNLQLRVQPAAASQTQQWAETSADGWSESPEFRQMILGLARNYAATEGTTAMLAELEGVPIATGIVSISAGVALLAGASTIPSARRQGAQSALLAQRLHFAVEQGCDLAMMCALPGSESQRNAQRNGFQIAYTRTKWKLE